MPEEQKNEKLENDELTLSNLKPAQKRKARKRVGRGLGLGQGALLRPRDQGPEVPRGLAQDAARLRGRPDADLHAPAKQRGPNSKDAMPVGPHRTSTVPVNLRDLERVFDAGAEVTLEALVEKGLIKNTRIDVKVLGEGELTKKLTVTAHLFSASAREKIEEAGGTATALRPPREEKKKRPRKKAAETPAEEPEAPEAAADEAPAEEPEATEEPAE